MKKTHFQETLKDPEGPTISDMLHALCNLKKPDQIREFVKEYEEWMVINGDPEIKGKEIETARRNIGYILGYLDEKERTRIYSALPKISHPIFGAAFGRQTKNGDN
jgi:hypothetical protein